MKIIVVDDERIALSGLELILNKAVPQADIAAFRQAKEALAYACQTRVDIAFLDVRMQEMNGTFLAKRLKAPPASTLFL